MKKIILIIIPVLFLSHDICAKDFFRTYTGLTVSGGFDSITRKDWFDDTGKQETRKTNGNFTGYGILLNVFAGSTAGELSVEYTGYSNSDIPLYCLTYSALAKYVFTVSDFISVPAGAGLYIDSPPSDRRYNGGGGPAAAAGVIYNISDKWKIMSDFLARCGSFGSGEGSTRFSYGVRLGIVYETGRI